MALINDWHAAHLTGLARGGAGLVVVEATAVAPEGRISPGCTGLWNDVQAEAFGPIIASIEKAGAVPGIQIAHAGRKASANRPLGGRRPHAGRRSPALGRRSGLRRWPLGLTCHGFPGR
jgi:2,4-dienoyl-CoA reductase-like NADH-dependent reductase (Old Yellow Enzyme family)